MARPLKAPAEKFLLDVDIFDSAEIMQISKAYGAIGEIVAIRLMCDIYRNGYYLKWGKAEQIRLLKQMPYLSKQKLCTIVEMLVSLDLFDSAMFFAHNVLTSAKIQQNHIETQRRYRRSAHIANYGLIDETLIAHNTPEPIKQAPPPPITDITDDAISRLLSDNIWGESVCMRYGISEEQLQSAVTDFRHHVVCYDKPIESIADAKRHFCNWLRKARPVNSKKKPPPQAIDYTDDVGFGSIDI